MARSLALFVAFFAAVTTPGCLATPAPTPDNPALQCRPFSEIYTGGRDLCERIFTNSFTYVDRSNMTLYNLAYTMWFFSEQNVNSAVSAERLALGLQDPNYASLDICWLRTPNVTNHKFSPSPEGPNFTECVPYRSDACCTQQDVQSAEHINNLYGDVYRWDRCGTLSPQCERFFVQEACMYECDPNIGLFRMYTPEMVAENASLAEYAWEVYNMPIQGDYCDMWFEACRNDYFCGDGDFFSCARIPPPGPAPVTRLPAGAIVGIVIGSIVLLITLVFMVVLIRNERRGTPVFQKISADEAEPLKSSANQTTGQAGARTPSGTSGGNQQTEIMTI